MTTPPIKINKNLIQALKRGMTKDQQKWFDKFSTTKDYVKRLEDAIRDMDLTDLDKKKKGGRVKKFR